MRKWLCHVSVAGQGAPELQRCPSPSPRPSHPAYTLWHVPCLTRSLSACRLSLPTALPCQFAEGVLQRDEFSDEQKGRMFEALAATDKCLAEGADEELQLLGLAAALNRIVSKVSYTCDKERW